MNRLRLIALGLLVLLGGVVNAQPTDAHKALVEKVSKKLIAVCPRPSNMEWPPEFIIEANPNVNANSKFNFAKYKATKKIYPEIRVFTGMLDKVIEGDEDRLALVLGHEIGHIICQHIFPKENRDRTEFLLATFWRDEEIEADLFGAALMLEATFDLKKGLKYIDKINQLGLNYSSIEGLGSDHPSWNDRMTRLDKSRERLWKSVSAFDNGVKLLRVEQYALAEQCFEQVTKDFPDCYEAWVNLGNACLMRYFDKFDLDDIKGYKLGQVLTPGFYVRAGSLTTRGLDDKLWKKAVAALNEALKLKPNLALARSNLGLAYLFHFEGKDVKKAIEYMQAAADQAAQEESIDPFHRATIVLNLAVALIANNELDRGGKYLDRARELGKSVRDGKVYENRALLAAWHYNIGLFLAGAKNDDVRRDALAHFEQFLKVSNTVSIWWDAAYDHYAALCKDLKVEVRAKDAFKPQVDLLRHTYSYMLKSGDEVKLTEELGAVIKKLGQGLETTVIPGASLKRIRYEKEGIDLLVNKTVVAICVVSPNAAPVTLRGQGSGSKLTAEFKVGMSMLEVIRVLGDGEKQALTDQFTQYYYYRDEGLGFRSVDGRVAEIVLATIPAPK